jgi:hypothetical protein
MEKENSYEKSYTRGAKKNSVKFDRVSFYLSQLSSLYDPSSKIAIPYSDEH